MLELRDNMLQEMDPKSLETLYMNEFAWKVCDQVLGSRPGYVRGLGNGPKPHRPDASSSRPTATTLRQDLDQTQENLATTEAKLASKLVETEEKLHTMESQQDMVMQILKSIGSRCSSTFPASAILLNSIMSIV